LDFSIFTGGGSTGSGGFIAHGDFLTALNAVEMDSDLSSAQRSGAVMPLFDFVSGLNAFMDLVLRCLYVYSHCFPQLLNNIPLEFTAAWLPCLNRLISISITSGIVAMVQIFGYFIIQQSDRRFFHIGQLVPTFSNIFFKPLVAVGL
jgi:hypothetical protein